MAIARESWETLNSFVMSIADEKILEHLGRLEDPGIKPREIENLFSEGYVVEFSELMSDGEVEGKIIRIDEKLRADPYERDKTLFHELAHVLFPYFQHSKQHTDYREGPIEWIGRRLRADPVLLRLAVYGFGLDPFIYDKASYKAFFPDPVKNTIQLSLWHENPEYPYNKIFMD